MSSLPIDIKQSIIKVPVDSDVFTEDLDIIFGELNSNSLNIILYLYQVFNILIQDINLYNTLTIY